ncbi:replication terminator protein [Paenibacillus sp. HN-1]|uniref:replication terminator protein n=1 Tax=Paenibacillus TaxID=44249 RepID=UPI001CA8E678|nr:MULTISPECIES: replication terminator protein [Paenibacillus]MBY9077167.1 replication terminator protein [Paenibacillus sp. CGMCC 1.18879]MBY9084437.1 replication terminator protein [Paenibacillus sinensis]
MSQSVEIKLESLADGSISERFKQELAKVLTNIADPNTAAKAVRKVAITLTIKPNDNREMAEVSISATSTLAPAKEVLTTIIMDRDNEGKAVAAELKSSQRGQTYIDNDGDVADDTGVKITADGDKIKRIY